MKSKLVGMAGGFAYVFIAVTSMPVHAEEIHSAITGSSVCLGLGEDDTCRGTVSHTVSKQLKNNGKKYNKDGSTGVGYSDTTFSPGDVDLGLPYPFDSASYCFEDGTTPGFVFTYDYASAVSTRPNGDLVYVELDVDDPRTSSICVAAFENRYEVTLYRKITGGTGQYAGACGWVDFNGTGKFLPPVPALSFSTIEGTQVGEIFVGDDCP